MYLKTRPSPRDGEGTPGGQRPEAGAEPRHDSLGLFESRCRRTSFSLFGPTYVPIFSSDISALAGWVLPGCTGAGPWQTSSCPTVPLGGGAPTPPPGRLHFSSQDLDWQLGSRRQSLDVNFCSGAACRYLPHLIYLVSVSSS